MSDSLKTFLLAVILFTFVEVGLYLFLKYLSLYP